MSDSTSGGDVDKRSLVQRERRDLAALFDSVGPDAPTLCEGWATRDLAAHLVLREGHVAAAGIAVKPLASWTARTQRHLAAENFTRTVDRFRHGPPLYSVMRLPGAEVTLSTFEHFVHHEDVRRASRQWAARALNQHDLLTLWQQLTSRARWYLRSTPVSVRLIWPDHGVIEVGDTGSDVVAVKGDPAELVLHIHGRRAQALVEIEGANSARRKWDEHELHG